MKLLFSNHTQVANKWLILLSGLNKNAVDVNGKKIYENQQFNLPSEWTSVKWSKTMIKQTLAYLGLANSKGDLGVIDLEELADLLHCSVRSLRNNHKTYIELGLIEVEELYGDLVHVKLVNYLSNFVDLHRKSPFEEDGDEVDSRTGYTTIKKEVLFDLFEQKHVNVLRIACRALYLQEKEVHLGGNQSVLLTSHTLKGFLPTYFSYRPVIERAVRPLRCLFDMQFYSVKNDKDALFQEYKATPTFIDKIKAPYMLSMKLKKNKNSREIGANELNDFVTPRLWQVDIRNAVSPLAADSVDHRSLSELVYEYGQRAVENALTDIIAWFEHRYEDISETAIEASKDFEKFRWSNEPIGHIRNIFKKYAIALQEGYLFQF